jgi:hypothetical protein
VDAELDEVLGRSRYDGPAPTEATAEQPGIGMATGTANCRERG